MTNYPPAPPPGQEPMGPGVPPGMYYDQQTELTLPNGVELASHGRRIGAYFLAIPLAIVTLVLGYLIWGAIVWGKGTSPALQVLDMKVWRPQENRPATWGVMALRNIIGGIVQGILWIITLIISLVIFLSGKQRKTIPDHIASTVVIYDPGKVLPR